MDWYNSYTSYELYIVIPRLLVGAFIASDYQATGHRSCNIFATVLMASFPIFPLTALTALLPCHTTGTHKELLRPLDQPTFVAPYLL